MKSIKFRKNQAITLIALILTIVIILIIAGITINSALLNNGIIDRAKAVKSESEKQYEIEMITRALKGKYAKLKGEQLTYDNIVDQTEWKDADLDGEQIQKKYTYLKTDDERLYLIDKVAGTIGGYLVREELNTALARDVEYQLLGITNIFGKIFFTFHDTGVENGVMDIEIEPDPVFLSKMETTLSSALNLIAKDAFGGENSSYVDTAEKILEQGEETLSVGRIKLITLNYQGSVGKKTEIRLKREWAEFVYSAIHAASTTVNSLLGIADNSELISLRGLLAPIVTNFYTIDDNGLIESGNNNQPLNHFLSIEIPEEWFGKKAFLAAEVLTDETMDATGNVTVTKHLNTVGLCSVPEDTIQFKQKYVKNITDFFNNFENEQGANNIKGIGYRSNNTDKYLTNQYDSIFFTNQTMQVNLTSLLDNFISSIIKAVESFAGEEIQATVSEEQECLYELLAKFIDETVTLADLQGAQSKVDESMYSKMEIALLMKNYIENLTVLLEQHPEFSSLTWAELQDDFDMTVYSEELQAEFENLKQDDGNKTVEIVLQEFQAGYHSYLEELSSKYDELQAIIDPIIARIEEYQKVLDLTAEIIQEQLEKSGTFYYLAYKGKANKENAKEFEYGGDSIKNVGFYIYFKGSDKIYMNFWDVMELEKKQEGDRVANSYYDPEHINVHMLNWNKLDYSPYHQKYYDAALVSFVSGIERGGNQITPETSGKDYEAERNNNIYETMMTQLKNDHDTYETFKLLNTVADVKQIVKNGDKITMTIRVYNEGVNNSTQNGKAFSVKKVQNIFVSENNNVFRFLPGSEINQLNGWKMFDANGNETQDVNAAVSVITEKLKDTNIQPITDSDSRMNYLELKIQFEVQGLEEGKTYSTTTKIIETEGEEQSEDPDSGLGINSFAEFLDDWNDSTDVALETQSTTQGSLLESIIVTLHTELWERIARVIAKFATAILKEGFKSLTWIIDTNGVSYTIVK